MITNVDQKAVAAALLRGQGCAISLKTLIENGSFPTESLVDTILDSFSIALSLMIFSDSPPPPLPQNESPSQNMADIVPKRSIKKKREGYEHYRDDCQSPRINDGYSWRKYGQKKIKTSTHQRSYYRCAYAKDQNCKATKRVQQIQENPSVYRTIYVGQHICQAHVFPNHANEVTTNGSTMIRFDNLDQAMSELVLPQLISVDQKEPIENEAIDHMDQEFDANEFLVDDDGLWEANNEFQTFSPGNFISLDDLSAFDYNTFQD